MYQRLKHDGRPFEKEDLGKKVIMRVNMAEYNAWVVKNPVDESLILAARFPRVPKDLVVFAAEKPEVFVKNSTPDFEFLEEPAVYFTTECLSMSRSTGSRELPRLFGDYQGTPEENFAMYASLIRQIENREESERE